MIIHNVEQLSDAWFDLKMGRVSGTSFNVLVSGKSTSGYKGLVGKIASEIISGATDENEKSYTNDLMERGLDLEDEAAEEFFDATGIAVTRIGFVTPDPESKYAEWIGISPDRLIWSSKINTWTAGLEIKCPLAKTHIAYIEAGRLPNEYRHQVQGSMFVTGLDTWYFMSYYPNMKPFILKVEKDTVLHQEYAERLDVLIKDVEHRITMYKRYDYLQELFNFK